jgi:hypothetical protein
MVRKWCGGWWKVTPDLDMRPAMMLHGPIKIEPYSIIAVHGRIRPMFSVGLDDA